MHYHVVLINEEGEHVDGALTFNRQDEAEERAVAVAREIDGPGWSGKRYPGRSWRRQELAVYIDRRVIERQVARLEVSIVRCDVNGKGAPEGCYATRLGLPWWKSS
jgi:hypothetical protein